MFGFISDKLNKGTFLNLYIQHEETFIFPFYCFFFLCTFHCTAVFQSRY